MVLVWLYGKWGWLWDPYGFWPLSPVRSPDPSQVAVHVSAKSLRRLSCEVRCLILGQFSLISSSQLLPNRARPSPLTTDLQWSICPLHNLRQLYTPLPGLTSSPVYVRRTINDFSNRGALFSETRFL